MRRNYDTRSDGRILIRVDRVDTPPTLSDSGEDVPGGIRKGDGTGGRVGEENELVHLTQCDSRSPSYT